MDLRYPPEADVYREKVRAFLEANLPADWKGIGALGTKEAHAFTEEWRGILAANDYLAVNWPKEVGGAGLSPVESVVLAEEFARAGVPSGGPNDGFGIGMLGNTMLRWGTDEQKRHYLPKILSGEHRWCQGYSEPNAGSDLGNLGCRAVLDGDEWIVNGQKIWTSAGHLANHIFVLARTDARRAEAQGHHVPARGHAPARRGGPPHQDDVGRLRVQRGVLHRRPCAEGQHPRPGARRLGRGHDAARQRARRRRRRQRHRLPRRARPAAGTGPDQGRHRRPGRSASAWPRPTRRSRSCASSATRRSPRS